MTAPHEETWTTGAGALSGALYSGDTWIGSFTDAKRARLAVLAPEMARVIREMLCDSPSCKSPQCTSGRAVLKAAAVTP